MFRILAISAAFSSLAPQVIAQERWETFQNDLTSRQGAYVCSEMNSDNGNFFCLELSCEAGAPLTMEFSHQGTRMENVLAAQISINGVVQSTYDFERSTTSGFANYRSQSAAEDARLRYLLTQGRSADIILGEGETYRLSLSGSYNAINSVVEACPLDSTS